MALPPSSPSLRTRVWSFGRWALLVTGLAATYGLFLLTSLQIATRAREVQVPDLRGQSLDDATATVNALGLTLTIDPIRRPDPKVPASHVLGQDPEPGAVIRRQRPLRLRLSDGARAAVIPDLIGESERAAQIRLAQDTITLAQTAEIFSTTYTPGVVVAQDPPASAGSTAVALLVNRGDAAVTYVMPDLIGTSGTRVADVLRRRLFRVTILGEVPYPGLPAGTVVRQSPAPGFQVAPGDPITLEVSR